MTQKTQKTQRTDSRTIDELVEAARLGDGEAANEIVRRYRPAVLKSVHARFPFDEHLVEDVAQDVLVDVFKYLDSYETGTSFDVFVRRVARNKAIDLTRVRTLRVAEPLDRIERAAPPVEEMHEDEREKIREAVESLPSPSREAVQLKHFEGMTRREIAEELGLSYSAACRALREGEILLAKRLRELRNGRPGNN